MLIDYEIHQDGVLVSSTNDPREITRYAEQYAQDGPIEVYTVLRMPWSGKEGGLIPVVSEADTAAIRNKALDDVYRAVVDRSAARAILVEDVEKILKRLKSE